MIQNACGDRKDFLQFLRNLPSLREGKLRRNCKRESEAEPNEGLEILYKGEKGAWGNMRFKESVIN